MNNNNLIKQFTVTGALFAVGYWILRPVLQNGDNKRKSQSLTRELELEHEVQMAEIKKNGKVSEETLERVNRLQKKL